MAKIQINTDMLLDVGAHFGHPSSKWNPNFEQFISSKKNGIHIIDLVQTEKYLKRATKELCNIVKQDGSILFIGTKKQARNIIQEAADTCGMYYIVERWLGGTLTNFATIKKSIKRLLTLEKESSLLKLSDLHRGIKSMKRIPSAIFVVDGITESIAIKEAKTLDIPTFGIIDSNTDPNVVDFPIPANDDSVKCIKLLMEYITGSINEETGKGKKDIDENTDTSENKETSES